MTGKEIGEENGEQRVCPWKEKQEGNHVVSHCWLVLLFAWIRLLPLCLFPIRPLSFGCSGLEQHEPNIQSDYCLIELFANESSQPECDRKNVFHHFLLLNTRYDEATEGKGTSPRGEGFVSIVRRGTRRPRKPVIGCDNEIGFSVCSGDFLPLLRMKTIKLIKITSHEAARKEHLHKFD